MRKQAYQPPLLETVHMDGPAAAPLMTSGSADAGYGNKPGTSGGGQVDGSGEGDDEPSLAKPSGFDVWDWPEE